MKNFFLLVLFAVFFSVTALPQDQDNSRAGKFHAKALAYYNASAYDEALEEANKAIRADENYINAWLLAGDIQSIKGNKLLAIESYKKAISIDSTFFYTGILYPGKPAF